MSAQRSTLPKITNLKVQNYRALREIEFKEITPLTVILGPNGSGKSTVFDVFAFLAECFEFGLRRAWDKRGRAKELKTRGCEGPIVIEIKYDEPGFPLVTYHLSVDESDGAPFVAEEWLQWRRGSNGKPFRFLDYKMGKGEVVSGEQPDESDRRVQSPLKSPDMLAVNTLGQLADHPRVVALRDFITGWYVSYISADSARGVPDAGPHERLSRSGDNLANVIQYLSERDPDRLRSIERALCERIPRFDRVMADLLSDGRLLLQFKDAPFDIPTLARFSSDGTLKMLSYLVILHDSNPPPFIGIEEPENFLHPRLLAGLVEECRAATARTQIFATTHSPFFLDALDPADVRVLWRDKMGFTKSMTAGKIPGVREFMSEGALLGQLWMEGHLSVGDPLVNGGEPSRNLGNDD
ncbi:MAG TPA: AAA family ATPase [Rectinemataceae bacterium]|nr:AAA family ATPase [Rectinemataceae bacterium]